MTLKAILKVSAAGVLGVALYAGAVGAQPTAVPRASQSAAGSPSLDKNRSADGVLPSGFPYSIKIPTNWNGVVVSDLDAAGGRNELGDFLVANGFAYVGTGRHPERMLKHDPLTELEAQAAVLRMVRSSGLAPRHTVQLGCSGGGFVALAMAEKYPDDIDGAVAFNARGTGGLTVANTWLDLPFALKALIAPGSDLKIAPVPAAETGAAVEAWMAAFDKAQTPQGRARIALAVAVSQFPFWGAIGGGADPKPDPTNLDAVEAALVRSARDGLRNAVSRRQLYDNPAGLASWNTGVDYAAFYATGASAEEKRVIRDLYKRAGLGGEDAIRNDLRRINAQPRIGGSAEGIHYWLTPGRLLEGDIKVPVLQIHGLGDALLPPHLLPGYAAEVARKGSQGFYRTGFIEATGHCSQSLPETKAALDTMVERLDSGRWPNTGPAALNGRAKAMGASAPRYVDRSFTPFNRAFHDGSPHPF